MKAIKKLLTKIVSVRSNEIKECVAYTMEHKKAFLRVEKELLGKNTLSGYLHDVDKMLLYFLFSQEKAHSIHTQHSKHHIKNAKIRKNYIQMIINWECARFANPDIELNARQMLEQIYPELTDIILPLLNEFNL